MRRRRMKAELTLEGEWSERDMEEFRRILEENVKNYTNIDLDIIYSGPSPRPLQQNDDLVSQDFYS